MRHPHICLHRCGAPLSQTFPSAVRVYLPIPCVCLCSIVFLPRTFCTQQSIRIFVRRFVVYARERFNHRLSGKLARSFADLILNVVPRISGTTQFDVGVLGAFDYACIGNDFALSIFVNQLSHLKGGVLV